MPGLLGRLAFRGRPHGTVHRLEVAAELEPHPRAPMVRQQDAAQRLVEHEAAGREVFGRPRLPDTVRVVGEEGEVLQAQRLLLPVGRLVCVQDAVRVRVQRAGGRLGDGQPSRVGPGPAQSPPSPSSRSSASRAESTSSLPPAARRFST